MGNSRRLPLWAAAQRLLKSEGVLQSGESAMTTSLRRYLGKPCQILAFVPASMYVASLFLPAMELAFDVIELVMGWQAFLSLPRNLWEHLLEEGPVTIL